MGIIFVTHGAALLYHQSVPEFGAFLNSEGMVIKTTCCNSTSNITRQRRMMITRMNKLQLKEKTGSQVSP
ncbi:MAG: hypothetical protein EA364_16100 [Balneolaceae bacterium]|nr:MAG: hypothetical protein EA364_16100 [Balneolaceae bacterium]